MADRISLLHFLEGLRDSKVYGDRRRYFNNTDDQGLQKFTANEPDISLFCEGNPVGQTINSNSNGDITIDGCAYAVLSTLLDGEENDYMHYAMAIGAMVRGGQVAHIEENMQRLVDIGVVATVEDSFGGYPVYKLNNIDKFSVEYNPRQPSQ